MKINWDATIQEVERGWTKGDYGVFNDGERKDGRGVCLVGGICAANDLDVESVESNLHKTPLPAIIREQFAARAAGLFSDPEVYRLDQYATALVEGFNDDADTTYEDVILVLEKARASETL